VRAKKQAIIGLYFTILLATIFTLLQGMEYVEAPFNINDSVFGSCFYMATGFHGFHVFIGTCCLVVFSFTNCLQSFYINTPFWF
jgi:cytochrome c oxidase subunit 3